MNFFLFFTVAVVSAFSIRNFEPKQLLKDPRTFIAAIANADPKVIEQLSDYAKSLIDEGEGVRAAVIEARNDANTAAAQANEELGDATSHWEKSETEKADLTTILAEKTTDEAGARIAMDDAWAHQVESQAKFDEAQATMDTELARIAQEDSDLKSVKVLLQDLMPALIQQSLNRHLLSEEDATIDPEALQKVIDLVASLLQQGELDAAAFTKARDDAQDVLTAAIDDHNTKKTTHTHSVGAKSVAHDLLAAGTKKAKNALAAKGNAEANKAAKDGAAANAEVHRSSEEARIDSERADFEKVIALLETLAAPPSEVEPKEGEEEPKDEEEPKEGEEEPKEVKKVKKVKKVKVPEAPVEEDAPVEDF